MPQLPKHARCQLEKETRVATTLPLETVVFLGVIEHQNGNREGCVVESSTIVATER
jgi:hypothetical protein